MDIRRSIEMTYDSIAPFFVKHREEVWPPSGSLLDDISPCKVADIGCGTGRLIALAVTKGCHVTGMDLSSGQLDTARKFLSEMGIISSFDLIKCDMETIPLPDCSVNTIFMIASLHHLEDRSSRRKALMEACRILKPGRMIQISVWSWDQERFRERHLKRISGKRESDEMDGRYPGDLFVPWKDGRNELRFYHLYGPGEIEEDLSGTGLILIRSFFDGRNHWVEAVKE